MLVNSGNTVSLGIAGIFEFHLASFQKYFALIRLIYSGDNFYKS
jgi:hypothetical protein